MLVKVTAAALKQTKWHQYAVRFFFGGLISAFAGLVAKRYGPAVGGLFLAFPAIFPASATLIEKHEKQNKEKLGLHGTRRGRTAASIDAAGASIGSSGLLLFALMVCWLLPAHSAWLVLTGATVCWLAASVTIWLLRKRSLPAFRRSAK